MADSLVYEYCVDSRQCPPGDWQPHAGWKFHERERKWELWWVSPYATPFSGQNISGYPGGVLDDAMPGTWIPGPGGGVIVEAKPDLRIEAIRGPNTTLIRVWRKGQEDPNPLGPDCSDCEGRGSIEYRHEDGMFLQRDCPKCDGSGHVKYVRFSGGPGYSYEGEVLATVDWDGVPTHLVRYWTNPKGDPPRKPYTLVASAACRDATPTAGHMRSA